MNHDTETAKPAIGTQHQFGYEWERYPEILPFHQEQFQRWIAPFTEADFAGKRFIDGGCGAGRNSYWALKAGATGGLAIDYDERTIAAAQKNLAPFPELEVRFQSIYELACENEFDVAFSIGVIHHLADPRKAVEKLVASLKPGGHLVLWVYGKEGNERYLSLVDPLRKHLTSRISADATRGLAKAMTVALRGYLLWPHAKPYLQMLKRMDFRQLELIVLDQLIPSIAFYWTHDEVLALVADLPLTHKRLSHTNGMSWTLVAEKSGPEA